MARRIAGCLLLAISAVACATTFASELEEVVVYGTDFVATDNLSGTKTDTPLIKTPQSVSIITRDLLDAWNPGKLTEALRYVPGAAPEPFGIEPRFTNLRLRGFDAATTGFYRDGLLLANPGFAVSYNLVPYGAERIEIPRGPVSVLYGQGNPGGLVNYISKQARFEDFGEFGVEAGSHSWTEAHVDAGFAGEEVAFRVVGLTREADTQVDFLPADRDYLAPSLTWQPSDDTRLTILASYQQDNTANSQALPAAGTLEPNPNGTVPIDRFTGEPGFDGVDRTEHSIGYLFEHRFTEDLELRQRARYNSVDLDDRVVFSNGLLDDQRTISRGAFGNFGELDGVTIDTHLRWRLQTGDVEHKLLFGIDYQNINTRSTQQFGGAPGLDVFDPEYGADITLPPPFKDDDVELDQFGLYVQNEMTVGERLIFNLALRADQAESSTFSRLSQTVTSDRDDTEVTARAGVVYRMDNGVAPYFSYAESFLPSAGTDAQGNPFEPETARQLELGVKYQPDTFDGIFTAAVFDIEREDFVDFDQNFQLFQTGQASSRGLELEAFAELGKGFDIVANYNYLDTEFDDHPNPALEDKEFTQIPDSKASVWVNYRVPAGQLEGLGFGIGVRHQSETWSDDLNTNESPGFTLLDLAVSYTVNRFRLALNVQNATDKEYNAACFERLSLLCTFGETRNVRGTLSYRW